MDNLDKQIKSMFSRSKARSNNGQGSMATCNICGKEGPFKAMPRHIEANHITGVTHACDICGKISRSRMHIFTFKAGAEKQHLMNVNFCYRTRDGLRQHVREHTTEVKSLPFLLTE